MPTGDPVVDAFDAAAVQQEHPDPVVAAFDAAAPRAKVPAKKKDESAWDYAGAVVRGAAHGLGIPTNMGELKEGAKDALLSTLAFPYKQAYDATKAGQAAIEKVSKSIEQPFVRGSQTRLSAIPIVGAPLAAVVEPAITYSEGHAPTHEQNVAAVEGGAQVAAVVAAPKVISAASKRVAAIYRSKGLSVPESPAEPPLETPITPEVNPEHQALAERAGRAQAEAATKPPTPRNALEQAHRDAMRLADERAGVPPDDGTPPPDNVRPIRPAGKPPESPAEATIEQAAPSVAAGPEIAPTPERTPPNPEFERIMAEYDAAQNAFHEAMDAPGANPGSSAVQRTLRRYQEASQAKWDYEDAHPSFEPNLASEAFDVDGYVKERVAAREAARTEGAPTGMARGRVLLASLKAKLVDSTSPITDLLEATTKRENITLQPSRDINNAIDRVYRAPSIAEQFAKDNGMADVIKDVPDLDTLDQYLIAKHAATIEEGGRATGRNLESDARFVEAVRDTYEPYAQQVSDYSRKLLDYATESGLVAQDLAAHLKKMYPDYVPLQRVFSEIENVGQTPPGGSAVASLSTQSIIRRLKGSAREIESPIESLMAKTGDAFVQGEKNKAARLLADYRNLPGNPFQIEEVLDTNAGVEGRHTPSSAHTFSYLEDGVKRTFTTTKEIAQAAKSLDVQRLGIIGRILAAPVRVARVGFTGINPAFLVTNVVRDQLTGFINSPQGAATLANPARFTRALFEAVDHGKLYDEMLREGALGTSFDMSRNQVPTTVASIRARKSAATNVAYIASHPAQWLRLAEDFLARGEEFTRIQHYIAGKEAALARGLPEAEARISAARNARENTTNFARRGEWGRVLNSTVLYLNANIQGTRTLLRSLQARPVATGTKIAVAVFTPVAIATAWNMKDPDRRAAYLDIAESEKETNIIVVPPNPTKDDRGRWRVLKIPLSQEINNLARVPRRTLEGAYGSDPAAASDLFEALAGTVSPIGTTRGQIASSIVPQAAKVPAELMTNRNFFTNRDIVPDRPLSLAAKESRTGGTAREIAIQLSWMTGRRVSPIQVEEAIRESIGGLGTQGINATDQAARLMINPDWAIGGESSFAAIYRRFGLAYGGETARKAAAANRLAGEPPLPLPTDGAADGKHAVRSNISEWPAPGERDENDALGMDRSGPVPVPKNPALLLPEKFANARKATWQSPSGGVIIDESGKPNPNIMGVTGRQLQQESPRDRLWSEMPQRPDDSRDILTARAANDSPAVNTHEIGHVIWDHDLTDAQRSSFTQMYAAAVNATYQAQMHNQAPPSVPRAVIVLQKALGQKNQNLAVMEAFSELNGQFMMNPSAFKAAYPDWYRWYVAAHGQEYIQDAKK